MDEKGRRWWLLELEGGSRGAPPQSEYALGLGISLDVHFFFQCCNMQITNIYFYYKYKIFSKKRIGSGERSGSHDIPLRCKVCKLLLVVYYVYAQTEG